MAKPKLPLGQGAFEAISASKHSAFIPEHLKISPISILNSHSGPGILIDRNCKILASNKASGQLSDAFSLGGIPALRGHVSEVILSGQAISDRIEIDSNGQLLALDIILLPLESEKQYQHVLVLGKDSTAEYNLIEALIASRQLFKDLVSCSSDFAWETSAIGRFTFVSSPGALGYSAHELNKKSARSLAWHENASAKLIPFESPVPHEDIELWMRRAD